MVGRVPAAIANVLLAIGSTLLCYVAMEYAVFRYALPYLPIDVRPHLPDMVDVLAQNSKAGFLPHDYVALLGDSYAEGLGDWLLQQGGDRTKPFHSADVIRQATGRDVVSFGKGGAGSAEAIVRQPARELLASRCLAFPPLEIPRQMFVYFYEGNDVEDNDHFLDMVDSHYQRTDAEAIDRYLAEDYAATYPWHCHLHLADLMVSMASFAFRYHVLGWPVDNCGTAAPRTNRLTVNDRIVDSPALLGPAMTPIGSDEAIRRGMHFAGVPVEVVYVPAALSIYRHAGDTVTYCIGTNIVRTAPTTKVERNHAFIRDLARDVVGRQGIGFLDATPALRAAASAQVIHGPRDWDHLNEVGYRALGSLVAAHVERVDLAEQQRRRASEATRQGAQWDGSIATSFAPASVRSR
jgi:hypothetical protein